MPAIKHFHPPKPVLRRPAQKPHVYVCTCVKLLPTYHIPFVCPLSKNYEKNNNAVLPFDCPHLKK